MNDCIAPDVSLIPAYIEPDTYIICNHNYQLLYKMYVKILPCIGRDSVEMEDKS